MDSEPDGPATVKPRSRRPMIVAVLFVLAAAFVLGRTGGSLTPIRCGIDHTPGADTVVMLSAAWCGYCRRARAYLQKEGIAHCEYDIETSERGRELFARVPVKVIPILMIRDDTLVGFDSVEIEQSLAAHGIIDIID